MHLSRRSRIAGVAIALLALAGLGLRFGLFLPKAWSMGLSTWTATGNFHSYFSVLTNLLVAITFLAPFSIFRQARVRGAITLYALLVGVVYEAMLRGVWHPGGAEFAASLILHDAVPVAVVAHWWLLREKRALSWSHPVAWLGFPLLYLAYAVARGELTGWWLYPFLDVPALGYLRVAINTCALLGFLLVLGLAMVAWDRRGLSVATLVPSLEEDESLVGLSQA